MSAIPHSRLLRGNRCPAVRCLLLALILLILVGARSAQASTINVPADYPTIQAAIDAASPGDTVAVAPGTYTGTGNVDITLNKSITVEGAAGAAQTIINCQGTSSANHRGLVIDGGTATVRGFTIENGYEGSLGGGIVVAVAGTSPTITQCVFTDCDSQSGGGIWVNTATDTIATTITQCVFIGNNSYEGGGIYVQSASLVCTGCVFAGNTTSFGGGIMIILSSTATITNCSFTANSAFFGGGICDYSVNQSDDSSATITNSLVYGNSAVFGSDLYIDGSASAVLSHSDIGNTVNDGATLNDDGTNISTDPLFVSTSSPYDLHLQAGSPALGLGSSSAPNFPTTDLDGNTWATPPAAGAYQGTAASTSTSLGLTIGTNPSSVGQNVTFTATVTNTSSGSSATPAGSVQFFVDGSSTPAATVSLDSNAQATYSTSSLPMGNHSISASFVANARFGGSTSTNLNQQVVGTPTANPQNVNVAFNTATPITLTGSDPDTPPLLLSYSYNQPAHGTLSGAVPNLTYAPTTGYQGSDSFTFTVSNGTNTSSPATVSINVGAGTPTANPQTVPVAFNTATGITLTGTDPDVPSLSLTYAIGTNPTHGSLSGTAPNLTYTPTAGYHGSDSFTFTVNNGTNSSSPATVSLTVAPGIPTANAQSINVTFNTATPITLTGTDPDVPPLSLTYAIGTNPAYGSLSGFNAATGAVTYTPTGGYSGPDSFTFTVNNGTNTSAPATVSITVSPQSPATVSGTVSISWGTAGTAVLTTNGDGLRLLPSGRTTDSPWLGINKLSVTLSHAATLSPADVTVTGINVANYGPVTISGSGTNYTLTLAQPISTSDRVTLTIGNASITTYTRRLDVLPGDVSDDGGVAANDTVLVKNAMSQAYAVIDDINGDGVIDINDYNLVRARIGTHLP